MRQAAPVTTAARGGRARIGLRYILPVGPGLQHQVMGGGFAARVMRTRGAACVPGAVAHTVVLKETSQHGACLPACNKRRFSPRGASVSFLGTCACRHIHFIIFAGGGGLLLRVEVRQARGLLWPAAAAATAAREQGGGQDAGGKADRAEIGLTEAALRARVRVGCKEGATPPVTVTSESPPPLCCLACCIPPLASYPSHGRMSGPPGAVCGRGGGGQLGPNRARRPTTGRSAGPGQVSPIAGGTIPWSSRCLQPRSRYCLRPPAPSCHS